MTKLLHLTHASTGPEAVIYALILRQHLITSEFFTGLKVLFPTKKRREAAAVRDKLIERTISLLNDLYPGNERYSIETLATQDKEGDATYPRYLVKVVYPITK